MESLEDPLLLIWGNARTRVANFNADDLSELLLALYHRTRRNSVGYFSDHHVKLPIPFQLAACTHLRIGVLLHALKSVMLKIVTRV